jgi:hypothetical protein
VAALQYINPNPSARPVIVIRAGVSLSSRKTNNNQP